VVNGEAAPIVREPPSTQQMLIGASGCRLILLGGRRPPEPMMKRVETDWDPSLWQREAVFYRSPHPSRHLAVFHDEGYEPRDRCQPRKNDAMLVLLKFDHAPSKEIDLGGRVTVHPKLQFDSSDGPFEPTEFPRFGDHLFSIAEFTFDRTNAGDLQLVPDLATALVAGSAGVEGRRNNKFVGFDRFITLSESDVRSSYERPDSPEA
jgi:hypothetical protein